MLQHRSRPTARLQIGSIRDHHTGPLHFTRDDQSKGVGGTCQINDHLGWRLGRELGGSRCNRDRACGKRVGGGGRGVFRRLQRLAGQYVDRPFCPIDAQRIGARQKRCDCAFEGNG